MLVDRRAPLATALTVPSSLVKRVTTKSVSPIGDFLIVSASHWYVLGAAMLQFLAALEGAA